MIDGAFIGREALKPNPALHRLQPFLGVWPSTGTHPMLPGKTFHGRTQFAAHEGGAFVIYRSEIDEAEIPSGLAIIGSHGENGDMTLLYFDERDVSRRFEVTFSDDGAMHWAMIHPKFSQRMTFTLAQDGRTMRLAGWMSENGGAWKDDLTLDYCREP